MSTVYPDVRFAGGPTYDADTTAGVRHQLFPFTYSSGTLDLPSSFLSTISTTLPGNGGVQVRRLGGSNLVQTVGNNLKSYIRTVGTNWGQGAIGGSVAITVAQPGIVTLVQQLGLNNLPATIDAGSYKVSTSAPANFIQYNSTWLFDKPLVIKVNTATPFYITFYTQWDH
jgi:hypothetical protein